MHPTNPLEKSFLSTKFSISVANDYLEPIFDQSSTPSGLDYSYSYPQDTLTPAANPTLHSTPVNNTECHYVNYTKPSNSLTLLFNQIKQTNVKDIPRSNIQ